MGYCYGINPLTGRQNLACDECGRIGGVRKRRCTYGYCSATALCKECYNKLKNELKQYHETHCKQAAKEYEERKTLEQRMLEEGKYLLCCALAHGNRTKAIFRNIEHKEISYFMDNKTYNAIEHYTPRTPDDYHRIAPIELAENNDIYSPL